MIQFTFDYPEHKAYPYNLTIRDGSVYVFAGDGTPLGIVKKVGGKWQQVSGREFLPSMALAIGEFLEQNSYI